MHDLFRFSFQSFVKKKIREKEEKGGKLFEKFFGEIGNIFPIVMQLCNTYFEAGHLRCILWSICYVFSYTIVGITYYVAVIWLTLKRVTCLLLRILK